MCPCQGRVETENGINSVDNSNSPLHQPNLAVVFWANED